MTPDAALLERFRADLDALSAPDERIGLAVSGGPDSLALLLLATAARPGLVEAATVDHGLRPESATEAAMVATVCAYLGVPHATLKLKWGQVPASNIQAMARAGRYYELGGWVLNRNLIGVATAHHADDQAETLLMRLARGSGVSGLAGVRGQGLLLSREDQVVPVVRPLLNWRKNELQAIASAAGLEPADDPSNSDERFDRTRVRQLLADNSWLDPVRLAAVARYCADADEAIRWTVAREFIARASVDAMTLDADRLPFEIQRRLLGEFIRLLTGEEPRGPDLARALSVLLDGGTTTLAGLKLVGGDPWQLSWAPSRSGLAKTRPVDNLR